MSLGGCASVNMGDAKQDTLFAGAPSTVEGLSGLLSFSRDLLSRGFEKSFPIRGAIVHGEYVFGKLTYGRAVIAAHELEQAQNWIGITCAPDLPNIETLWSLDLVVCYPAPLKRGPMKLHPVVSWPVPPTERLMRLLTGGGLTRGQGVITWELGEKANNTILFRLYQEILHKRKMFVVHGHDDAAKTNLEVFLHEVGLEPVVLHRQADQGLTVIEKFEKHSEVGYAFILLTPDEAAYLAADEQKPESERKIEWRARPNVIFEFGYFIGKLGRSRVCCLYTGNVSLPSDISGMIYKRYEKSVEEVGYSIIKDLKAAGYEVA